MSHLRVDEARALLGDDVLGAAEVVAAFGGAVAAVRDRPIPFSEAELVAARDRGEMLVLRAAHNQQGVGVTLLHMIERFPELFDQKLLRQVGYQLKDEWGILLEPLAATETCTDGWALVRKDILAETRNLPFDDQEPALRRYAEQVRQEAVRRRTVVEAVYDSVVYCVARQKRLLEKSWDWSGSRTLDGGYLNVGGFGARGMQILAYSKAIRHGALGVCPTRQPSR